jgi:hypothetical protein
MQEGKETLYLLKTRCKKGKDTTNGKEGEVTSPLH